MANPWKPEQQRGRNPEAIRAFERPVFAPLVQDRPFNCRCTWAPRFTQRVRSPAGPHDTRPQVLSWHADGFLLKFTNVDCPARRRHG